MLTKSEIIMRIKKIKPVLENDFSVKEIGLFGSFSDGSNTESSDIDLLIEFNKNIGWKYFSLELYLQNVFGRKIDLVTKNALKDQIKEQILKQVSYI